MIERKSPLRVWSLAVTSIALALVVGSLWTEAAAWQEPPPPEQESPTESNPTNDPEAQEPTESPTEEGGEQDVPQEEDPAPDPIGGEQEASTEAPSSQEVEPPTSEDMMQAQPVPEPGDPETLADAGEDADAAAKAARAEAFRVTQDKLGLLVLLPAGIAILLAILTRQVVISLAAGVLVGAYMVAYYIAYHPQLAAAYGDQSIVITGFRLFTEHYLMQALLDPDHLMILVFTLSIGFMIGIIGENGGTRGLVKVVVGNSPSRRKGAVSTWFAGLVVFFDDYANTMIVGPTMRSVFDKVKMSRAKLAYIVDSTAAPVSSIALIGTWVGAEVGFIQGGLDGLGELPAFLAPENADGVAQPISAMTAFIQSIPYRFYPILALVLVFIIAWTGRDFGPMRKAEQRALDGRPPEDDDEFHSTDVEDDGRIKPRPALGLIPILVLVFGSLAVLWATGTEAISEIDETARQTADTKIEEARAANPQITLEEAEAIRAEHGPKERSSGEFIQDVISEANSYIAILYGALISAVVAVLLSILAGAAKIKRLGEAGVQGMTHMFPALVILVLAWCLSAISDSLFLGDIVAAELTSTSFDPQFTPLAVFLCAALISFASGTSWGTMGILCPMTVTIAAQLGADLDPDSALELFYASVGSVLAGAIFGDHCSPISDTTVLSSVSAGCSHEEHVWTQIPYALLTAVVAMGVGDFGCRYFDQPWYVGVAAGIVVLFLFMFLFGRKPKGSSRSNERIDLMDEEPDDAIRYRTEESV
ncbi:MAG: Na+/H+ antiporter NhaC family protein [Planctomycetota bacterium]